MLKNYFVIPIFKIEQIKNCINFYMNEYRYDTVKEDMDEFIE